MACLTVIAALVLLPLEPRRPPIPEQSPTITLATTTSVRDTELLDHLLPPFEARTGYRVKVIAVGSGQALELGRRGEADLLIVHDPAGERRFLADGFGVERVPLMANQFVLVGPRRDPAGVGAAAAGSERSKAVEALRVIAAAGAARTDVRFVSRADRSGTHTKEKALWALAGGEPGGGWYLESGQGMSATLQIANEHQAYTLSDVGTFLSHRYPLDLAILLEGDTLLANPYHIVTIDPAKFAWLHVAGARALRDYLVSPEAQRSIGAFKREAVGRSLFVPAVPSLPPSPSS